MHQLTLDNYLQEKMVPTREDSIILSYIKLGPKADELLNGNVKVIFSILLKCFQI